MSSSSRHRSHRSGKRTEKSVKKTNRRSSTKKHHSSTKRASGYQVSSWKKASASKSRHDDSRRSHGGRMSSHRHSRHSASTGMQVRRKQCRSPDGRFEKCRTERSRRSHSRNSYRNSGRGGGRYSRRSYRRSSSYNRHHDRRGRDYEHDYRDYYERLYQDPIDRLAELEEAYEIYRQEFLEYLLDLAEYEYVTGKKVENAQRVPQTRKEFGLPEGLDFTAYMARVGPSNTGGVLDAMFAGTFGSSQQPGQQQDKSVEELMEEGQSPRPPKASAEL